MATVHRSVFVLILCASASACVGPTNNAQIARPTNCSARTEVQPYTAMGISAPMSKLGRTTVQTYRWTADTARITPCSVLGIKKEIWLQRERGAQGVLKEVREFYAEDGTLIVRNSEDVTKQLARSGQYAGHVNLPIPSAAPPGRYRIVSKLTLEIGDKSVPLAQATVNFQVVAPEAATLRPLAMGAGPRARVLKNGVP